MTPSRWLYGAAALIVMTSWGCGGSPSNPTAPSAGQSFLTGTWRGGPRQRL
jgi:hypothetical protein